MGCFKVLALVYRRWLENLAYDMDDLKAIETIFQEKIRKEEMVQGRLRGKRVRKRLKKVQRLEKAVQNLPLLDHGSISNSSDIVMFVRHAHAIYKIKKALTKVKIRIRKLKSMNTKDINNLLHSSMPKQRVSNLVDEKGRLSNLLKLYDYKSDNTMRIIGIHGMGGVGKTVLMRQLYRNVKKNTATSSETVIKWIDVSIDCNIHLIQGKIDDVLDLNLQAQTSCSTCRTKKKYILFLDDVWDVFDFEKVGSQDSGDEDYKERIVIFTTRNLQLCLKMNAVIFQVHHLNETESYELLKKYLPADEKISEAGLPIMNRLCHGLPLAIVVLAREIIGKRLSSIKDLSENRHWGNSVLLTLKLSAKKVDARDILGEFRYRFGNLTDKEMSCLLYCCFVDLENVKLEDIVNQLVGEENLPLLPSNLSAAKAKIHAMIKRLESICLLQRYQRDNGEHLKMHSFIREILSLENHTDNLAINSTSGTQNWETAKRVLISVPDAEKLLETTPLCLNLHSFLIHKQCVTHMPTHFFTFIPALRFLDLSHNNITSLPRAIKCLTELQYLNLSFTKLLSIPLEMCYLTKLRQLYLRTTSTLNSIPRESFSGLLRLQALDFVASQYWENQENHDPSQLKFEDLQSMYYLEEFGITITRGTSLGRLLKLNKLCQVTTSLVLRFIKDKRKISQVLEIMWKLKKLQIESSRMCEIHVSDEQLVCLEELSLKNCDFSAIVIGKSSFNKLRHLTIGNCNNLCDIEWARFAPHLKYLDISSCDGMKKLFECQTTDTIRFSNLESLKLSCMSSLKIVCSGSLALPSLQELKIDGCGELEEHLVHKKYGESTKPMIFGDGYVWLARSDDMLLPTDISISLSSNDCSTFHRNSKDKSNAESEIQVTGPLNPQDSEIPLVTSEIEVKLAAIAGSSWTTNRPEKWSAKLDKPETSATQETNPAEESESPEVEDTSAPKPDNLETSATQESYPMEVSESPEVEDKPSAKSDNLETSAAQESNPAKESESPKVEEDTPSWWGKNVELPTPIEHLLFGSPPQSSITVEVSPFWVDKKGRLSKLRTLVEDKTVNTKPFIGILGMVGVGKTALMRQLYEGMTLNYDRSKSLVAWIQVSANPCVMRIQDQIAKALNLDLQNNNDVRARASCIFGALSLENNRILFLDDVGHALDFEVIGIPTHNDYKHQTGSVLIFTTRYPQVCIDMKAQVYQVPFLDEKESCELFKKHLGLKEDFQLKNHQKENLNQECDGLPLAVALLAKEVKKRSTDVSFADSLSFLSFRVLFDNSPDAMKDTIAAVKRDFSRLTDEEISCMCYCSLLGDVEVEKGVNILVGEGGILDLSSSFAVAKEKKITTLKKLEELSLLQRYLLDWNAEHLKIQNFIKEVILMDHRLDHLRIKSTDKSLFRNWETATRLKISLQDGEDLPEEAPLSNKLHSLLMGVDEIVPGSFFSRMPFLRVLDLSGNNITFLPESIGCLMELQYLNLSYTRIEFLPSELGNLKKLRQLYLRGTFLLKDVPKDAVSGLAALQVLDFLSSAFNFNKKKEYPSLLDLTDLEIMHYLEEFSITITEIASLSRLLSSNQLCLATMSLILKCINNGDLITQALPKINSLTIIESHPPEIHVSAGQLVSLEKLSFVSCNISKIVSDDNCMKESSMAPFRILWHLTIYGCSTLQDISWIRFAPSLKCLQVWSCHGIKELIKYKDNNQGKEPFSKLAFIKLAQNRRLENIYKGSLSLPSLRKLDIYDCPHFKEHLFREKNTDGPKTIIGESPYHWTADAADLLLPKYISPSICHFPNDWSTARPEEASEVPHDISKSDFDLTEPSTSQSRDNVMSKTGFNMIEPDTSQSRDDEIRKSGFHRTEPGTSQSRDDETMKFRLESADNEGMRFRLRWLESPDDEDMGTPLETSGVWVDHKDRLSELKKLVGDESDNREQIIGILGMVGVGKTALMRQLYKEMTLTYDISESLVAWIQVSAYPSVIHIQDQMAKALNLDLQNNNDVRERASCIFRAIGTKKRCILLLDDVADALDFEGVGIPTRNEDWHEKKRVFIFTTRYSQVCFDMNAQIFEVPLLSWAGSYELFKRHLSVSVDGSYEFKDKLHKECHGLPLAIQLLAREAEKRWTNISCDSDLSLTEMYRVNPDALNGALAAIFKPTYGRLTDEDISCLLYLSLVSDMEHENCVSALVGKEINPDPSSSLSTAKEEMNNRMKKLESMLLLRRPHRLVQEENNKMHNFIKQTIMMGCHPDHVTVTSATECPFKSWERARCVRISLPYNIEPGTELPDVSPICSKLHSLFIRSGHIPSNFFTHMSVLRVLDLSGTKITILPISVKYLLELQYINLSSTSIKSLPKELGNLKNLRQLYLKDTSWLVDVPRDAVCGLAKLQSLHFFGSCFEFFKSRKYLPRLELRVLEGLHQLEEFSATINDETFLRGLLTSNLLRKATVSLRLQNIEDDGLLASQALETLSKMKEFSIVSSGVRKIHLSAGKQVSLEKLNLWSCDSFSKIDVGDATCLREPSMAPFHALLHLEIYNCPEVRDIAWVQLAPSLRSLTVVECNRIRELIVHNGSAHEIEPWSQLEYFILFGNENLEIIYSGSLSLPSLSKVLIDGCPKLMKHHLQTNSTDSATIVIDDDLWEWTADPDDLLLPKNIRPTVSYLPDEKCGPIENPEQDVPADEIKGPTEKAMSSSKWKKHGKKLKGSSVAKGMTLVPLRKSTVKELDSEVRNESEAFIKSGRNPLY